ncbi:hypothetical protein L596_030183 [Steinernema carpocapsae]|uniref:Uncharacterized protein n=1 Tax=Steinernema carpocapsae TaxID=34508 RepID=A0A4U5LRZ3_STECR|nr:hypothetical protein L596_030183 [Steinernema carpocapsae]
MIRNRPVPSHPPPPNDPKPTDLAESPTTSALRLGWPSATVVLAILLFSIFTSFTSTTNPPKHFTLNPLTPTKLHTPFQTPKSFPDTPTPHLSFPTEP